MQQCLCSQGTEELWAEQGLAQIPKEKSDFVTAMPTLLLSSFAELQNSGCERKQNLNTFSITLILIFVFVRYDCPEFFYLLVVNTDSAHYCDSISLPLYINVKK